MKNCEYCNYYRSINDDATIEASRKIICTFAGTIITADAKARDKEYPCSNLTYYEYESKMKYPEKTPREKILNLKFMYRSVHLVVERERTKAVG